MCKTIKQRVEFKAPLATGYDLLTDSKKRSAVMGRKAIISRKVGGWSRIKAYLAEEF